jgi:hypothetical protein
MPSDVIIKIECPLYLRKFLEKLYGEMPIVFPRNDDLSITLDHLLDRPPKDYNEDSNYEGMLLIQLNFFEDKDVRKNWYLPEKSKRLFIQRINRYFKLKFRDDVNKSRLCGFERKAAINIFIDKFELNDDKDIYDLLEKDYRRYYEFKYYRKKRKNKVKKVKINSPVGA